jgi:hypothetical protein
MVSSSAANERKSLTKRQATKDQIDDLTTVSLINSLTTIDRTKERNGGTIVKSLTAMTIRFEPQQSGIERSASNADHKVKIEHIDLSLCSHSSRRLSADTLDDS